MELKDRVKSHWEHEVCGIRFAVSEDRRKFFQEISSARYAVESYIPEFADFENYRGKAILEIGVGAGSDFERWVLAGADATGIDLTRSAVELTRERLRLSGVPAGTYRLVVSDAEQLEFPDNTFDLVYAHGVLHHSPDTQLALQEVWRVLKPGGHAKLMVYGVPSWTGLMLWVRYGLFKNNIFMNQKNIIYNQLESPETKAYKNCEFIELLKVTGFAVLFCERRLTSGDLLAMPPSSRYEGLFYKLIWRLYPRNLIKKLGQRMGLAMIVCALKPEVGQLTT